MTSSSAIAAARGFDARGVRGGQRAKLLEDLALNGEDFFFGFEDFDFELLQLRRGEAFGVDQGLFALVIGGREVLIRFGDFDVVAEDVVEADFERRDAGAGALALLDLGEVCSGCCGDVAQLVELGIEAVADRAAVGEIRRAARRRAPRGRIADFGDFVEPSDDIAQPRGFRGCQARA